MGWRGALRSAIAASRAAERDSQRRARALQRGHDQVDRVVDRLNAEVERDMEKLGRIEERLYVKPLSASGIHYDAETRRWAFEKMGDQTGGLKWSLDLGFPSDSVAATKTVVDGVRSYEFVDLAATRWGVFVAFRVSNVEEGSRPTKLFNKSNPSENRLFLQSGGTRYRALEGQIDKAVPAPGGDIALVAFPLPKSCGDDLAIEFVLRKGTAVVPLTTTNPAIFSEAAAIQSLVDMARERLAGHTDPIREQAKRAKEEVTRAASSNVGWLTVVVVVLVLILVMASG